MYETYRNIMSNSNHNLGVYINTSSVAFNRDIMTRKNSLFYYDLWHFYAFKDNKLLKNLKYAWIL